MRRYFRVKWILADLLKTVLLGSTPVEKVGARSESRDSALTERQEGAGGTPALQRKARANLSERPGTQKPRKTVGITNEDAEGQFDF